MLKVNKLLLGISICFLLTSCESPRKKGKHDEPVVIKMDNAQDDLPKYTVQEGDTVGSVAYKNNMTRADLITLNDLTPPYELYAGQKLVVKQLRESTSTINNSTNNINTKTNERNDTNNTYKFELVQEGGLHTDTSATKNSTDNDNTTILLEDSIQLDTNQNDVNNEGNNVSKYIWPISENNKTIVKHFKDTNEYTIIQSPSGTPVKAIADGVVKFAGTSQSEGTLGYGKMVIVKHSNPSRLTLYAKLGTTNVSKGQKIKKGTKIGTVSKNGNLYFSLMNVNNKNKRTYIDPESIIDG